MRSADAATTQELHLVALHVLCGAVDRELALREPAAPRGPARSRAARDAARAAPLRRRAAR